MSSLPAAVTATASLRQVLDDMVDALAHADLDRLLTCERQLEAAVARLKFPGSAPGEHAAIAAEIARARESLSRCRRLGGALSDVIQIGLLAHGLTPGYGRAAATTELHAISRTA